MIPRLFQTKTKVAFIDDDVDFLENFNINNHNYQAVLSDKPDLLIQHINQTDSHKMLDALVISGEDFDDKTPTSTLMIKNIQELMDSDIEIYHAAVVDFNMPMMNGFEFCQKITDINIKKILLTSEADHETALEGFNKKIIDHFLKKTQPRLLSKLNVLLNEYQGQFFHDLSQSIICLLKGCIVEQIYKHSDFWIFMEKTIELYEITKFALYDSNGSFKMIDVHGRKILVNAYTKSEMIHIVSQNVCFENLIHENKQNILSGLSILDYKNMHHRYCKDADFINDNVSKYDLRLKLENNEIVYFKIKEC